MSIYNSNIALTVLSGGLRGLSFFAEAHLQHAPSSSLLLRFEAKRGVDLVQEAAGAGSQQARPLQPAAPGKVPPGRK